MALYEQLLHLEQTKRFLQNSGVQNKLILDIILGSGLGELATEVENPIIFQLQRYSKLSSNLQ